MASRGTVGSSLEGAAGTEVNPGLEPSYADEFSVSVEREIVPDTSVRVSYVRKQLRNDFGEFNGGQVIPLLEGGVPFTTTCTGCPLGFEGQTLNLVRVPDAAANAQDNAIDTFPGGFDSDDYDTLQVAFDRRFSQDLFFQTSFDYQWRDERRSATNESTSPLDADPLDAGIGAFFQNHSADFGNQQDNTNWNFRALARYVLPVDVAVSGNVRVQSGWPWAPIFPVSIPGSGTQTIFLGDVDQNRSETVPIVDLRVEKGIALGRGRLTGMLDVYNLFNGNQETNFNLRTGSNFNNIIATLDPRAVKLGVRYQF